LDRRQSDREQWSSVDQFKAICRPPLTAAQIIAQIRQQLVSRPGIALYMQPRQELQSGVVSARHSFNTHCKIPMSGALSLGAAIEKQTARITGIAGCRE